MRIEWSLTMVGGGYAWDALFGDEEFASILPGVGCWYVERQGRTECTGTLAECAVHVLKESKL